MSPSLREPVVHNAVRLDEKDRIPDTPVSGFTAVNGRSPPQTLKLSGNGSERRHSRPELSPESDRRPPSQQPDRPDRPPSPRPLDPEPRPSSPAKRKRSLSDQGDDEAGADSRQTSRAPQRDSYSPSSEEEEEEEEDDDEPLDHESGDPSARDRDSGGPARLQERPSGAGTEADRWAHERPRVDAARPSGQYADVLQREPQNVESSQRKTAQLEGQPPQSNNDYGGTTEFTRAGVQVDVKKRKRVFSNRTKTGCQTCRRRKKKCDEAKPDCNNCIRGGFVCEGYLIKTPWPKPGAPKSHVPLQSKHGYAEHPGIYPRPATEPYQEPRPPQSYEGARARPIVVDEERTPVRNGWAAWTAPQDRVVGSEYGRTAPPSEALTVHRNYNDHGMYPHAPSTAPIIPPLVHQPPGLGTSHPAVTAQLALQQSSASALTPQVPLQGALTEKEKMVSGQYFLPYSPQLIEERQLCKAALWKFNSAAHPTYGVSREEQVRLLQAVVQPPHARVPVNKAILQGCVGKDVYIETPFHCDYGYNVVIGDDVVIGPGCTIIDARRVRIGSRSVLGPNVNIYTLDYNKNARDRKGSKALAYAEEVYIAEDVYIGGNVTILPGATIGAGAVVAAGSVVTKKQKIERSTLVAGCPARKKEHLWDDSVHQRVADR